MSFNMRAGRGMDGQLNLERIAEVICRQQPDYVGLQKVDSLTDRSEGVDQVTELGRMTGMHPLFAAAIPYEGGGYGIAALVREQPLSVRTLPLPGKEEPRTSLVLEYPDYLLFNTHLSLTQESREHSIRLLRRVVEAYGKPALITGDFNMEPHDTEVLLMGEGWTLLSDSTQRTFPADQPNVTIDYIWGLRGYSYRVSQSISSLKKGCFCIDYA